MGRRRRLLRILLNAATVASFALCAATVVLWLRSYVVSDYVHWMSIDGRGQWDGSGSIQSLRGLIVLEMTRLNPPVVTPTPLGPGHEINWTTGPPGPAPVGFTPPTFAGFGWGTTPPVIVKAPSIGSGWVAVFPLYAPTLLFAPLPLAWLRAERRWRRTYERRLTRRCPACGYDLRATPDRCPECGAASTRSV